MWPLPATDAYFLMPLVIFVEWIWRNLTAPDYHSTFIRVITKEFIHRHSIVWDPYSEISQLGPSVPVFQLRPSQ
jgi:hypothetical protein